MTLSATASSRLFSVAELESLTSLKEPLANVSAGRLLLGNLSVAHSPVAVESSGGMGATFEDATGSLPVILCGFGAWDTETLKTRLRKKSLVLVTEWNPLMRVHGSKGAEELCLEFQASSLLCGSKMTRHFDFEIPPSVLNTLPKLVKGQVAQAPLIPTLDVLPVRITAKSELFLYGGSRKGFMVKADCYFPSIRDTLTSSTAYKLVAYILFNQDASNPWPTDLEFTHESLQVGQYYLMHHLKPYKIKVTQDASKKILVFHAGSSFRRCEPSSIPHISHCTPELSKDQLAEYTYAFHSDDPPLISYSGLVTRTLDSQLGIYELDDKFELYTSFHCSHSFSLRAGAKISLHNVHVVPGKKFVQTSKATLVACHFSSIQIEALAPDAPKLPVHSRYTHRKWIAQKYSSAYEIMQARMVKDALAKVLYFTSDADSLYDQFAIDIQSKHVIHELVLFSQDKSEEVVVRSCKKEKEASVVDFLSHSEKCRFMSTPPKEVNWLTPSDILALFKDVNLPKDYDKGYHHFIKTQKDLDLSDSILLGILDSDSSGQLKLMDASGKEFFCVLEDGSLDQRLSLATKKHLWAFKKFALVTEICGYVNLGHYTLKQYVRLSLMKAKSWKIYESTTSDGHQWLCKLLYPRPVSMDMARPGVLSPSCIVEGMVWPKDSLENGYSCWLQLSLGALSALPFLRYGQGYFWIKGMATQVGEELVFDLIEETQLSPCLSTDPAWHRVEEIERHTMFPADVPVVDVQTFLSGYEGFKAQEGMFDQLVSIQGRVVSKSTASVASWNLDWGSSPEDASQKFNIGMGFLDRTIVVKIQDLQSPVSFNIYCDIRKMAYPLDLVPGNLVQFRRLGIQMSKTRNLYGIVVPVTTVDILEIRSNGGAKAKEALAILSLSEITRYTATFRVLCSIIQVKRIGFKKNASYSSDSKQVTAHCTFKIEDGSMEAFVDLFSVDLLQAVLDVPQSQVSQWERAALPYGDFSVVFDDDFDNAQENPKDSNEPIALQRIKLSIKSAAQSIISPNFCLATCIWRERSDKLKIRNLKLHGTGEGSTPVLCHEPLRLKLIGFQRNVDLMDIVHQANLWEA